MQDLKTIRQQKNLTQSNLSELSGLSQPHIVALESGQFLPRRKTRQRIERILGSEIDWVATYAADRDHIGYVLKELLNPQEPGMEDRLKFCKQYLHAIETLTP